MAHLPDGFWTSRLIAGTRFSAATSSANRLESFDGPTKHGLGLADRDRFQNPREESVQPPEQQSGR
jgi:hypothetical protein